MGWASAAFCCLPQVTPAHCLLLEHCLWSDPKDALALRGWLADRVSTCWAAPADPTHSGGEIAQDEEAGGAGTGIGGETGPVVATEAALVKAFDMARGLHCPVTPLLPPLQCAPAMCSKTRERDSWSFAAHCWRVPLPPLAQVCRAACRDGATAEGGPERLLLRRLAAAFEADLRSGAAAVRTPPYPFAIETCARTHTRIRALGSEEAAADDERLAAFLTPQASAAREQAAASPWMSVEAGREASALIRNGAAGQRLRKGAGELQLLRARARER